MVIWNKILNVVVILNFKYFVVATQDILTVNNKPTKYNQNNDLTEIITVFDYGNSRDNQFFVESEKINLRKGNEHIKSYIFKPSNFVPKSNFRPEVITKHNFTLNSPHLPFNSNYQTLAIQDLRFNFLNTRLHLTERTKKNYNVEISTTTIEPFRLDPEIVSAIILSNDILSNANSDKDGIAKTENKIVKKPITSAFSPILTFSTKTSEIQNNKKIQYNKNSTSSELNQRVLGINCSNLVPKNSTKELSVKLDDETVVITPRPIEIKRKNKQTETEKDKRKKKKQKCKNKRWHHHDEKHSKESHEEYKNLHESHKVATYSHLHSHQHQINPTSLITPVKTARAPTPSRIKVMPSRMDYIPNHQKLPPLSDDYEEVGNMFDTFYHAFENAFTAHKDDLESIEYESREYYNDESEESISENSENESEGEENEDENYSDDYQKRRRKRRDLSERKNDSKSKPLPRKSFKTQITITNEFDDSHYNHPPSLNQTSTNFVSKYIKKQNKNIQNQNIIPRSTEEYDIIGNLMNFEIDFDSYSYEEDSYDSLNLKKRLNISRDPKKRIKNSIWTNESSLDYITDGFKTILSHFASFLNENEKYNYNMKNTKVKKKWNSSYDDNTILKTNTITKKYKLHFNRSKREDKSFPLHIQKSDSVSGIKHLHPNWIESSRKKSTSFTKNPQNTKENIFSSKNLALTSSRAIPYDLFGMFSKLLTSNNKQSKNITRKRFKKSYKNYQLLRLLPKTKDDVSYLNKYRTSVDGFKVHWLKTPVAKDSVDVVVSPSLINNFKEFLVEGEIQYIIKIRNIQHAMKFENPRLNKRDQIELELINGHPLTWYRYHNSRDIQMYYDYIKRKYPNFVELIQIGWSFNGKPLTVVKVSHPKQTLYDVKKPAIFILSGTSAHIWLPIACSTYILNSLVTNISNNDGYGNMIRKFDWYVLSLLNPDGYDYAMMTDRFWQKSRSHQFLKEENFISSA